MSLVTISDGTFTKTVNTEAPPKPKRKRTAQWRKALKAKREAVRCQQKQGVGKVSTETRERLHREAEASEAFAGMPSDEIKGYVTSRSMRS